jgi:hypothetical protein
VLIVPRAVAVNILISARQTNFVAALRQISHAGIVAAARQ